MQNYLILISLLIGFVALIYTYLKRKSYGLYEFFPSFFWIALMLLPLLFQGDMLAPTALSLQVIGVSLFSFFLFLGDFIASEFSGLKKLDSGGKNTDKLIAYLLIGASLVMQILHSSFMQEIPLLTYFKDVISSVQSSGLGGVWDIDPSTYYYMELREASSKTLLVPLWFIYLCQASLYVFVPLAVLLLLPYRKYFLILAIILISIFYSRITLAKGPSYIFLSILVVEFSFYFKIYQRKIIIYPVLFCLLILGSYSIGHFVFSKNSIFKMKLSDQEVERVYKNLAGIYSADELFLSLPDHYRLHRVMDPSREGKLERYLNFLAYRIVLVPSETAHYWYLYYSNVKKEYAGLYGLTPASRQSKDFVHLANEVGRWGYVRKIPAYYTNNTIRAYCSVDADAFARGGFWGIILAGFLVLLFRLSLALFKGRERESGTRIFYAVSLFLLGSALPASSLQAFLISQGGIFCLLGLLLFHRGTITSRII